MHKDSELKNAAKKEQDMVMFELEEKTENGPEDLENEEKGLKGDYGNIFLLLFLYLLQGLPLGLSYSLPLILVNKGVSYDQQAIFSIAFWPFSIKLLWAPIVDSMYYTRFGRRKSWLIPCQLGIGLLMILISFTIHHLVDVEPITGFKIHLLTVGFFVLIMFSATQDIAVDGWALTLVEKRNLKYVPSCNSVGQSLGIFIGSTVFLALESADFCNQWLRSTPQDQGIVTLESFFLYCGITFLMTTLIISIFKKEKNYLKENDEQKFSVIETYRLLYKILCMPAVRWLALIFLTLKVAFSATEVVTPLKLVEYGLRREHLSLIKIPLIPIHIIMPWIVTRLLAKKPLSSFANAYPFRLVTNILMAMFVYWTMILQNEDGSFNPAYYVILILIEGLLLAIMYCHRITIWAFMTKISDPVIGGTYMTMLDTLGHLGGVWPATVVLGLVNLLSFKWCKDDGYFCDSDNTKVLGFKIDGYYTEVIICTVIGLFWILIFTKKLKFLESAPSCVWKVLLPTPNSKLNVPIKVDI